MSSVKVALYFHQSSYSLFAFVELVSESIFKLYVCLNIFGQNKRKSGFGASDELSSEEEEGVQQIEANLPASHQERHPATTWPTSAPVTSVRKRKSNPKPTIRPQVNLIFTLCGNKLKSYGIFLLQTVTKLDLNMYFTLAV